MPVLLIVRSLLSPKVRLPFITRVSLIINVLAVPVKEIELFAVTNPFIVMLVPARSVRGLAHTELHVEAISQSPEWLFLLVKI
jgi:hypothetical protein